MSIHLRRQESEEEATKPVDCFLLNTDGVRM